MINFRLNYHSLPRRTKRNSLAVKREHDSISVSRLNVFASTEYSYSNALRSLSEIFYNTYI